MGDTHEGMEVLAYGGGQQERVRGERVMYV